MLAQNFMTADALGITDEEISALIKTLGVLERGEVKHVVPHNIDMAEHVPPDCAKVGLFNMNWCSNQHDCGTVLCIGGTAEAIMKRKFGDLPADLRDLFHPGYPDTSASDYDSITPDQAASALRNYLTTGAPKWSEAIA